MAFPVHRMRRLRACEQLRSLVRETRLVPSQFILPLFVCPGEGVRREIRSMPGNFQLSIDEMVKECEEVRRLGIGGVILFGIPEVKDEMASGAYAETGIVQRALIALKQACPGSCTSPMSATANTPAMGIAASSRIMKSRTT